MQTTNAQFLKLKLGLDAYLRINYEPEKESEINEQACAAQEDVNIAFSRSLRMQRIFDEPPPFYTHLYQWIDKKKVGDIELYKKAQIDRKLFSKMKDRYYQPSKETIFKLVLALELTISEAKEFMEAVGFSFSRSSRQDLIVKYCIENHCYDVFQVNELLDENGEHTL